MGSALLEVWKSTSPKALANLVTLFPVKRSLTCSQQDNNREAAGPQEAAGLWVAVYPQVAQDREWRHVTRSCSYTPARHPLHSLPATRVCQEETAHQAMVGEVCGPGQSARPLCPTVLQGQLCRQLRAQACGESSEGHSRPCWAASTGKTTLPSTWLEWRRSQVPCLGWHGGSSGSSGSEQGMKHRSLELTVWWPLGLGWGMASLCPRTYKSLQHTCTCTMQWGLGT